MASPKGARLDKALGPKKERLLKALRAMDATGATATLDQLRERFGIGTATIARVLDEENLRHLLGRAE